MSNFDENDEEVKNLPSEAELSFGPFGILNPGPMDIFQGPGVLHPINLDLTQASITLDPNQASIYQSLMFRSEEELLAMFPNAIPVTQEPEDETYSYSVELEVTDDVIKIFNDEWALANSDRDFGNRVRRALQKVAEHWGKPTSSDDEIDITVNLDGVRKKVGSGKISITDEGLTMIGQIYDENVRRFILGD